MRLSCKKSDDKFDSLYFINCVRAVIGLDPIVQGPRSGQGDPLLWDEDMLKDVAKLKKGG